MIEKISQTLETVFDRISKHLKIPEKYSAARRNFTFRLLEMRSNMVIVFDMYYRKKPIHMKQSFFLPKVGVKRRTSHEPNRMLMKLKDGEQRVFLICIRFCSM